MLSAETNFSGIYSFFGPGVINGWDITKLSDERADQILLLDGYNSNASSEYGQKLSLLNLDFSVSCLAATTTNISLTGTQTIDGVALVSGDIVLVKDQSIASQNGIYVVSSGAWSRHSSLDSSSEYTNNFIVYVSSGTSNQNIESGNDGSQITAIPNQGYRFESWSDGVTANPRTDTNVLRDVSVTANFTADGSSGGGGGVGGYSPPPTTIDPS